jgi:hypothetical protein
MQTQGGLPDPSPSPVYNEDDESSFDSQPVDGDPERINDEDCDEANSSMEEE